MLSPAAHGLLLRPNAGWEKVIPFYTVVQGYTGRGELSRAPQFFSRFSPRKAPVRASSRNWAKVPSPTGWPSPNSYTSFSHHGPESPKALRGGRTFGVLGKCHDRSAIPA